MPVSCTGVHHQYHVSSTAPSPRPQALLDFSGTELSECSGDYSMWPSSVVAARCVLCNTLLLFRVLLFVYSSMHCCCLRGQIMAQNPLYM